MCGAAFALGGASSTACPASYGRLHTGDACASAAGKAFGGSGAYSYYPAGCFWHSGTGSVYYNTHVAGAANYYAQPLCAGAAQTCPHEHVLAMRVCVPPPISSGCYE